MFIATNEIRLHKFLSHRTISELSLLLSGLLIIKLISIEIACWQLPRLFAFKLPRINAFLLNVCLIFNLDNAIAAHNLIISLVPYISYAEIIKLAIKNKISVILISYVSPAVRECKQHLKKVTIIITIKSAVGFTKRVINRIVITIINCYWFAVSKISFLITTGTKISFQSADA